MVIRCRNFHVPRYEGIGLSDPFWVSDSLTIERSLDHTGYRLILIFFEVVSFACIYGLLSDLLPECKILIPKPLRCSRSGIIIIGFKSSGIFIPVDSCGVAQWLESTVASRRACRVGRARVSGVRRSSAAEYTVHGTIDVGTNVAPKIRTPL